MKQLFIKKAQLWQVSLSVLVTLSTLLLVSGCIKKDLPPPVVNISTIATGLSGPIGLEIDKKGVIWVAQGGSGKNDGKVSAITPDGKKYDVIVNFASIISPGGEPDGPTHLLFANDLLYILGTGGKMYTANVSALNPGGAAIDASSLDFENIGAFVLAQKFAHPTGETHPYNLTIGQNGDIFIADAAANAIIRRQKNGVLSVVAEVPGIPNTTPVGPPTVESVPTGLYYDGQDLFVTTLLGFPFPAGMAVIYRVNASGSIAVYQQGFTSLVDIAKGGQLGKLVLEHGSFGAMGFVPNTGRLLWANGTTFTVLTDGLNQPAGLKQADGHTWYVANFGDNTVLKVTY